MSDDSSDDKVVSLRTRQSYAKQVAQEKLETTAAIEQQVVELDAATLAHKAANLKMLEEARVLIEGDQMEGLIIIGRHRASKYFHTNLAFDIAIIPPHDVLSYLGVMDVLRDELMGMAQMAPALMPDGSLLAPHIEMVEMGEDVS